MTPENLARRFHNYYEKLAPEYGYETRRDSAVPWEDVPLKNRRLMIAVAEQVLGDLAAVSVDSCEHTDFVCQVKVNRINSNPARAVRNFAADIEIECAECGTPFYFLGAPIGLNTGGPTVSALRTQLRAPIRPVKRLGEANATN